MLHKREKNFKTNVNDKVIMYYVCIIMHTEQAKRNNLSERPVMSSTNHCIYKWSYAKDEASGIGGSPPRCSLCYPLDVLDIDDGLQRGKWRFNSQVSQPVT